MSLDDISFEQIQRMRQFMLEQLATHTEECENCAQYRLCTTLNQIIKQAAKWQGKERKARQAIIAEIANISQEAGEYW